MCICVSTSASSQLHLYCMCVSVSVCVCQKVIQDEPKMFSREMDQLVFITHNTVPITSSAVALKATCGPGVTIRAAICISVLYSTLQCKLVREDPMKKTLKSYLTVMCF